MLALLLISLLLISSDRSTAEKPRQGELQQCFSSSDEATTESFGRECLPDGLPHVDGPAKDAHHVSAPTGATAETRGSEQRVHSLRKQLADLHQEIHSASQVVDGVRASLRMAEATLRRLQQEAAQLSVALGEQPGAHGHPAGPAGHSWAGGGSEVRRQETKEGNDEGILSVLFPAVPQPTSEGSAAQAAVDGERQAHPPTETTNTEATSMQAGLQTATSRGVHTAQARIPEPSKILAGSTAGVLGSTLPYRVTPRQYGPHWLDHFLLLAAVQLQGEAKVTAMAPLYTQVSHPASERPPSLMVVGDDQGVLHVMTLRGHLVMLHSTGTSSSVTCISSYAARRNETLLLTGHASGEVRVHTVALVATDSKSSRRQQKHSSSKKRKVKRKISDDGDEEEDEEQQQEEEINSQATYSSTGSSSSPGSSGSGGMPLWKALDQGSIQGIELRGVLIAGADKGQGLVKSSDRNSTAQGRQFPEQGVPGGGGDEGTPASHPGISYILPYRVTPRANSKHLVAVWDERGWLRVLRENGTVRWSAHANTTLLAAAAYSTLLLGLGETRVYVQSLRLNTQLRSYECTGLNGTRMLGAAFDPVRQYRAYAVNDQGQLLILTVPSERRVATCKVVRWRQLPVEAPPPAASTPSSSSSSSSSTHNAPPSPSLPPLTLGTLPGYLVVGHPGAAAVFNVTSTRTLPPAIVAESMSGLAAPLGISSYSSSSSSSSSSSRALTDTSSNHGSTGPLLLSSSRVGGLLLMGLGGGSLAVFESGLPVAPVLQKGGPASQERSPWAQPILVGIMICVGIWQFVKARNRINSEGPYGFSSRMGRPGGTSLSYNEALAAIREQRARDGAPGTRHRGGSAGLVSGLGGRPLPPLFEEEDGEDEGGGPGRGGSRAAERDLHRAFGGFAGPRSVRRAMRMGVPPVQVPTGGGGQYPVGGQHVPGSGNVREIGTEDDDE